MPIFKRKDGSLMKQAIINGRKLITIFSVLSILLVSIFSVFTGVDLTAVAEAPVGAEIWGGYRPETNNALPQDGSGTETDPYIITNGDQLWKMVKSNGIEGGHRAEYEKSTGKYIKEGTAESPIYVEPVYYKLANDIYLNDISNYAGWTNETIGLNNWHDGDLGGVRFFGHIDGDGHTIYGLYVNSDQFAAFIPQVGRNASIKNLHFRNSYVVNTGDYPEEWKDLTYGSAAVVISHCAGDKDDLVVQNSIDNCSVKYAYVESKFFTAGIIGRINDCYPCINNSIVSDIELNSTQMGVEGGVFNDIYGSEKVVTLEGVISIGYPLYGTQYADGWNGHEVPIAAFKYLLKNCYSDINHSFTIEKGDKTLKFPNPSKPEYPNEVETVKLSKLKGEAAKEVLDLDWEHNWKAVEGDYPVPANQYIVPTGDEYYANGGPKADIDMWNGKASKTFAAGTGTINDPYLIETCEQFYKMVTTLNTTDYYKIADGVEALYFNDIRELTYEQTIDYLSTSKRAHKYSPGSNNFGGYFDGNGVTIYGVKAENELLTGLFPTVGTCTLKNFTVKNSYFYAPDDNNSSTVVEGAAAVVGDLNNNTAATMRSIAVVDCYVNSPTKAAGLVACSHTGGCVFIDDCLVAGGSILSDEGTVGTAAFVAGSNSGTHTIKNSISTGVYPAADNPQSYNSRFVNVYTSFDPPSQLVEEAASGVIEVENAALISKAAKETCKEFDWEKSWQIMRYEPMPLIHKATFGTPGEAWSGEISDAFAGGTGSKSSPYQIDTPERLAQMVAYSVPGAYYELTADININDTTVANWQDSAKQWFTSANTVAFTGIFDGKGKTIKGIYNNDIKSGEYGGFIPVLGSGGQVRNLFIKNSQLNGSKGATIGAVAGTIADKANNVVTIRACHIDDSVKLSGAANVSGMVGSVGLTKLKLDNSISYADLTGVTGKKSGLVGDITGKLEIKESISIGVYPFSASDKIVASGIYTDVDGNAAGVTTLENSKIKGDAAKTNLTALNFEEGGTWMVVDDNYPQPTGNTKPFDGVQGEPWTGEIATQFAGGDGSPENPFLIATAEQLSLATSAELVPGTNEADKIYCNTKSYKLIADIYLNDIYDPLWKDLVGCLSWYSSLERPSAFTGNFDGDGYGVFGMYYNNPNAPKDTYVGLFPVLGGHDNVIKNVAVSNAYIDANINEENSYAGGIFGMISSFYDFYGKKTSPAETVDDQVLIPATEDDPAQYKKLIKIEQCIVDHNSIIKAGNVGGIGNPGGGAIVIYDCIVTATITGRQDREGALIGNSWAGGTRLYNSVAFPQNDIRSSSGAHQWIEDEASIVYYHEDVYYYGSTYVYGTTNVPRPQWRVDDEAKTAMPNLDWQNVWTTVKDGTPIPRIFNKADRSGDVFSDKTFLIPNVQINFITGDPAIQLEPLVGKPYTNVTLPTISRLGYKFTGWYSFADITLEYPYEYFLSRDINLYAGWEKVGLVQDFEDYLYSSYDCDLERWNYNKPGSRGGYNFDYVHSGTKSMQLLNNSAESADLLINYEEWLTVGQNYTLTFWVATDKADTQATMSLVQNNHPQIDGTEVSCEPMVTVTGQSVGEWKQYSFDFTAQTNWISIRATGNSSLYIDDVIVAPTGEIIDNSGNVIDGSIGSGLVGDTNIVSPNTADGITVAVMISAIIACAIVAVISKKSFTEVIDNI